MAFKACFHFEAGDKCLPSLKYGLMKVPEEGFLFCFAGRAMGSEAGGVHWHVGRGSAVWPGTAEHKECLHLFNSLLIFPRKD